MENGAALAAFQGLHKCTGAPLCCSSLAGWLSIAFSCPGSSFSEKLDMTYSRAPQSVLESSSSRGVELAALIRLQASSIAANNQKPAACPPDGARQGLVCGHWKVDNEPRLEPAASAFCHAKHRSANNVSAGSILDCCICRGKSCSIKSHRHSELQNACNVDVCAVLAQAHVHVEVLASGMNTR